MHFSDRPLVVGRGITPFSHQLEADLNHFSSQLLVVNVILSADTRTGGSSRPSLFYVNGFTAEAARTMDE